MEKIIATCGLACDTCDARIATIANNDVLREQTAEKWRVQFSAPGITTEMINCTGCREPGVKFHHCSECEIRKCATDKNYKTCSECNQLETCTIVCNIFKFMPDALDNLKSLQ